MKKVFVFISAAFLFFSLGHILPAFGQYSKEPQEVDIKSDIESLKNGFKDLEDRLAEKKEKKNMLSTALAGIEVSGGISAGSFYASNPGPNTSDSQFSLSNFLVEISSEEKKGPVSFAGAFGESSTPSLFDTPGNNRRFDIEYASLLLNPTDNVSLEAGLLLPNAGYEDTYTFNNRNIVLGALASQQPYNEYGARLAYSVFGLEIGAGGSVSDFDFNIYNYHLEGMRNLTGIVTERTVKNVSLAFNLDYWKWNRSMKNYYGNNSSVGMALYISPHFERISFL